jgi:NitT/TauT family transport system substrate-binding protein
MSGGIAMPAMPTRRRVLSALAIAGAAGLIHAPRVMAAEERLETTSVRLGKSGSICIAPEYVAEELLRAEGFTDIRYLDVEHGQATAFGKVDFASFFASSAVIGADGEAPFTVLTGLHAGCFELFGNDRIHSIADLKGKRVGVPALGGSPWHAFLSVMAAQVGLDPGKDIDWVTSQSPKPAELFAEGKIDAFLGFPPEPQDLRARNIGHVVVNSAVDRPWSEYFCCMLMGAKDFVRGHPVATKRVMRAILKAADLCASDPAGMARRLVAKGFAPGYDYAVQTLRELPYGKWREYDAEDTLRFYALRLHEAGLIKSSPQKIISGNTDWRFLNELKRELKT